MDKIICHCRCGSLRHIAEFWHDKGKINDISLYVTTRNIHSIWKRIKDSFVYIFKGEEGLCYFDLIIEENDLDELAKMIDTQQRIRHTKAKVSS